MNSADMVVVSGAGTGIGRAVARRLTGDGFHVLAVGRRREPLDRLAKELAPHVDVAESNVLTSVLLVEALRETVERDGGRVVLLSSVAALRGSGGGPYGAVKAALHGFAYDLARELGAHGECGRARVRSRHRVLGGRLTGESRRERAAQTLVGREGTPEEVASLIAWLIGPDGGWVTGQVLSPNGGVVLGR